MPGHVAWHCLTTPTGARRRGNWAIGSAPTGGGAHWGSKDRPVGSRERYGRDRFGPSRSNICVRRGRRSIQRMVYGSSGNWTPSAALRTRSSQALPLTGKPHLNVYKITARPIRPSSASPFGNPSHMTSRASWQRPGLRSWMMKTSTTSFLALMSKRCPAAPSSAGYRIDFSDCQPIPSGKS